MTSDAIQQDANPWNELPESIRSSARAIHELTPPSAEVESFLDQLTQRSPDSSRRRIRTISAAISAVAVSAVIMFFSLSSSAAHALQEIARALNGRTCVKMISTEPSGTSVEHWYLPGKQISAWRDDEWVEFRDHATQITHTFDRKQQQLYRTSDSVARRNDFVVELVNSLCSLAENKPVRQIDEMEVVESKIQTIERDGHRRQELTLKLRTVKRTEPIQAKVLFGSSNKLPEIVELIGQQNGENIRHVTRFEYPEHGPADIFDLTVPRDAPLVNRIPSTDIKRLVSGVYAGRVRFDDYRAIVLQTWVHDPKNGEALPDDILMIAKKGTTCAQYRLVLPLSDDVASKPRSELGAYLLRHCDELRWYPVLIAHGQTVHNFDPKFGNEGDKRTVEMESVHSYTYNFPTVDEFILAGWHSYPHLAGRPPLGIGRQDIAAAIASELKEGPEGCVLLETRLSGRLPEAAGGMPDGTSRLARAGLWIRADREFLVMQDASSFENESGYQFILDELARSPQGHWYPVRARRVIQRAAQSPVEHYSYHLDFTKENPDRLFDPQTNLGKR
jgi:hypothetical protein